MKTNAGVPKVSVIIPCRNESKHIAACMENVCGFTAPEGGFEIIVVDGTSNDGTRELLSCLQKKYPDLRVFDNPQRTVPYAMNLGIQHARGEYIVRTDARCVHPRNYLVELLRLSRETGADNVGGVLVPVVQGTYAQKSIALAYKSRIAMGGALRDRGDFVGETDTVYGGCFRKDRLIEIGMYDEEMVRNQDDELSFRLRKKGGRIVQSGSIKVHYSPRAHFAQLFKQFMQYGYWKVEVIKRHPQQGSLRHLLPGVFVSGLVVLTALAPFSRYALAAFLAYLAVYLFSIGCEAFRVARNVDLRLLPGVAAAIALIHTGFGAGFMISLIGRTVKVRPKSFETLSR